MFVFHDDGTMQQSNPPAGNTETSDTAGMGVWEPRQVDTVRARFEEFRHDLGTGEVTRGVIDLVIEVHGDTLSGSCKFNIVNPDSDEHVSGPHHATLEGRRVVLD
jgi:hypothetical protein